MVPDLGTRPWYNLVGDVDEYVPSINTSPQSIKLFLVVTEVQFGVGFPTERIKHDLLFCIISAMCTLTSVRLRFRITLYLHFVP